MTSLFTARRRAEEFAGVIDGGSETTDASQARFDEFVAIVAMLRGQDAAPRPEFTGALREHLMTEAESALKPQQATLLLPVRQHGARERRLVAAASAVVLIGGTATMAAASQSSLPGEALYPIKRGIEGVEASLSLSDAGKGQDLLAQAEVRLTEVGALLTSDSFDRGSRISATLTDFSTQAGEGSTLLLESFEQTGDPESVLAIRGFATDSISTLESLAETVPADAQDELAAAALTLRDIDEQATSACATCMSDVPVVEVPDILLARAEVNRVLETLSVRELDNSHPVVVPTGALAAKQDSSEKSRRKDTSPGRRLTAGPGPAAGATQAPEVPANPALPGAPLPTPPLPGSDEQVAGGDDGAPKLPPAAPKPAKKLSSAPGGPVQTLLPEPEIAPPLP